VTSAIVAADRGMRGLGSGAMLAAMNIDRRPVSAVLVAAPAIAFFGMWWWRDRSHNRWVREAVARRKRHAQRWS
jgi:hypothetical protein